ncbi:MAG: carbon-nitrogen hydrolase family protein [Leptonema sp. (in: bacteria)]
MKSLNNILKIAVVQYEINKSNIEENLNKVTFFVSKENNDIIVLPEMGITGYDFVKLKEIIKKIDDYINELKSLSKNYKVTICTTLPYQEEEAIYNRLFFITPDGKLYHYDKQYLINWGGFLEKNFLVKGNSFQVVEYKNWLIGFGICYDLRFPELFYYINEHSLKTYGDFLKLIIIPSQWPKRRVQHMVYLARARAIENLCYVVSANAIGSSGNLEFNGQSQIIDPDGNPLIHLNDEEGIFSATIELNYVNQIQRERPILRDRFFLD